MEFTYRNVLPRMLFLTRIKDKFINKKDGKYYPYGKTIENQLEWAIKSVQKLPDDSAQELHHPQCAYCGKQNRFSGKGDHIFNKTFWERIPYLDHGSFRANFCKSCNSSKLDKDFLDWWINHKKRDVVEISMQFMNLYSSAMWKICEVDNKLDDKVPKIYQQVIDSLMEKINQPSYQKIWE